MELQQTIDPIKRTSTPLFGTSSNYQQDAFDCKHILHVQEERVNNSDEDKYYNNFRSKLDAPLKKACLRGIYGPKPGLISGHFAMVQNKPPPREYTYIMRFSREFSTRQLEYECDSYATQSSGQARNQKHQNQQWNFQYHQLYHKQQFHGLPQYYKHDEYQYYAHQIHQQYQTYQYQYQYPFYAIQPTGNGQLLAPIYCLPINYH